MNRRGNGNNETVMKKTQLKTKIMTNLESDEDEPEILKHQQLKIQLGRFVFILTYNTFQ